MKQDNRYSKAIEQIKPDEGFINDTLNKLNGKKRKPFIHYAVPAVAMLAVIAIAVSVFPRLGNSPAAVSGKDSSATNVATVIADSDNIPNRDADAAPAVYATALPPEPNPLTKAEASAQSYYQYDGAFEEDAWFAPSEDGYFDYWNTDEYSYISESGFKSVLTSPLSTFAADVDTASYSTVRRALLGQYLPSVSGIRVEEMLNYFNYYGLAPEDGAPAAINAYLGKCPWNEDAALMFVGIGSQKISTENLPKSNLVFLIDTSGSMDGSDRLDLAKRAFHLLCDTLSEGDTVSVVTYSGSFTVLLEGVDASRRAEILAAVDSLEAYGSTNGGDAIVTAYAIAEKHFIKGGNNRVIMMTDGDLNVGITSESELVNLIEDKKQSGVFLSVLGFGMGNYKDNKLEALADHGNGNYSRIDGIQQARRVMVNEMGANFYTVAKDVKIQVEFNPEYVSSYRLIGYENRALSAEDFINDSVDGGEMGSGHTVVALYEIIPAEGKTIAGVSGKTSGDTNDSLRYQSAQTNGIDEVALISIRYKAPDSDVSELISKSVSPGDEATGDSQRNLTLASGIAQFGMLLRDSEFKGSATYDSTADIIKGLQGMNDDEAELLYLVTIAKNLE